MIQPTGSPATPRTKLLLFSAALATALGMAAGGGACSSSTLPGSPGTGGSAGSSTTSGDAGSPAPSGDAGTTGAAGAGVGGTTGSGGGAGSSCVVTHRATPAACPPSVASTMQTCQVDTDCTGLAGFPATGHCVAVNGQKLCSYDTCLSDDDCGARPAICLCEGQWHVYSAASPGNTCRSGTCRDDSDCPGTACSPSVGFGAVFYGFVGAYCHTPNDQCRCDSDCASPTPSCAYNPEIGAWACASFGPAG